MTCSGLHPGLEVLCSRPGTNRIRGKGRKQRSVALLPQTLTLITAYLASNSKPPKPSDPLIRKEDGSGDGLSYHVINRVVTRWTKRQLGVRLTPHKLRHAYGRQCVDLGVDIRIIAEALGHESLESTKIYTQVPFQRTRSIAALFCSPGESNNPGQNGQHTQSVPAGLNFQK